jgi:hypothetical protein
VQRNTARATRLAARAWEKTGFAPSFSEATHQRAQDIDAPDNALRNALEVEVKLLREMLDAMREDRDAWRDQAGKITAALPAPIPDAPLHAPRRSWWRRLTG